LQAVLALDARRMALAVRHVRPGLVHHADRKEYLDFLGRLFRFQEAALRYCLETSELNLTTVIDADDRGFKRFQASVQRCPELVTYLETQRYNNEPLDRQEPYTPCLLAIIPDLVENGRNNARLQRQSLLTALEEEDALDRSHQAVPVGHNGLEKGVRRGVAVAVSKNVPITAQDAHVHGAGVQVGATRKAVSLGVEAPEVSSSSCGCSPDTRRPLWYAEGGPQSVSTACS
jgi:hypothetical protein